MSLQSLTSTLECHLPMNSPLHGRIGIVRATDRDAAAISALVRWNADAVLSADYSPEQLAAWKLYNTPARIRERLAERTTFCAFHSERLCGTIGLKGAEMVGFYVSWRGRGVGRMLLAHLEAFAAQQGIRTLHLTSSPSAVSFYRQGGWRGERPVALNILGVRFPENFMTKTLGRTG